MNYEKIRADFRERWLLIHSPNDMSEIDLLNDIHNIGTEQADLHADWFISRFKKEVGEVIKAYGATSEELTLKGTQDLLTALTAKD